MTFTQLLSSDQQATPLLFFLFSVAAGIRWVPQHPLMLPQGRNNIHLTLSGGIFFSFFRRSRLFEVNNVGKTIGHGIN